MVGSRVFRVVLAGVGGTPGRLAADHLVQAGERNAVTVAALAIALTMAVTAACMASSFQHAVEEVILQNVPADLLVTASGPIASVRTTKLPDHIRAEISDIPGIAAVGAWRFAQATFRGHEIFLAAIDLPVYQAHATTRLATAPSAEIQAALRDGTGLAASNNLLRQFKVKIGDWVELPNPNRPVRLPILWSFDDYSSPYGMLAFDLRLFHSLYKDHWVDSLEIYAAPGADVAAIRTQILARLSDRYAIFALTSAEFRHELLRIVSQGFTVIRSLELIGAVIALLGVLNTLLIGVLERQREIAILRAIGMQRSSLYGSVMMEGVALTLLGVLLGAATGFSLVFYHLTVTVVIRTGWTIPAVLPVVDLAVIAASTLIIAALAGLYPARMASKLDLPTALQYE